MNGYLNKHFAAVSIANQAEGCSRSSIIFSLPETGFKFHKIALNDVIIAISHLYSQAEKRMAYTAKRDVGRSAIDRKLSGKDFIFFPR